MHHLRLLTGVALLGLLGGRAVAADNPMAAQPPPPGWKLVWHDEFDQPGAPDATKWSYDVGGEGWGNRELQFYTDNRRENARVEDGHLVIEARHEKWRNCDYTSARLVTKGRQDWTSGRFEIRARLPSGRGTWPAIWMLPTVWDLGNGLWPDNGEIDIMEHVGHDAGVVHASTHSRQHQWRNGTQRTATIPVPDATTAFHTYALEWEAEEIRIFVDDRHYFTSKKQGGDWTSWPFIRPFYLVLNVAIGGDWGAVKGIDSAALPQRMLVDYVRVYQRAPAPAAAAPWSLHQTARDTGDRLAAIATPATATPTTDALVLDPAQRFQEMIGFGGALTESSAWVLAQLPPERRREVLKRYFDPKEGIGYTLARTHLNSCDFSLNLWSLAEVPGDYDLHHFSLEPMRRWLLPLLHDAREAAGGDANFRLQVSPWSPPAWMKTNFRMDDGGSLRREYAAAWANLYVRFAQAMEREEKLPVWAFSVQNEPEAHQVWESCLYTPEQERDFIKRHLGPALASAGLAERIKLLAWDHNRDRLEARADAVLGDPEAARYVWGLGLHWYVSDDFAASARVHERHPGKPILFTEGCWEGGDKIGDWGHGEGYARQMIGDFKHWVAGFIDWNIALDQRGGPNHVGNFCDAPVIVDTRTKEVSYSAAFHYIGHFSRFVRPGARRIASSGGPAALDSIAFQNPDGSLVAVVMNRTDAEVAFTLQAGEALACRIPAHAIQSYVRRP